MSAKAVVDEHLQVLKTLRLEGQIDDSSFYKMVVCLSSEYIATGEYREAYELIQTLPKGYFLQVQKQQMIEDPEYSEVATEIARCLVEAGLVSVEDDPIFFTQKDEGIA